MTLPLNLNPLLFLLVFIFIFLDYKHTVGSNYDLLYAWLVVQDVAYKVCSVNVC